jgi:antitoxin (DNA-binding transcriptional repressor) of toxin-antitoxin stability system
MKASVMDLRYRTKEILRALDAKEEIILTHRGNEKGKITPIGTKSPHPGSLANHRAIGMWADAVEPVPELIDRIRKPRVC